MYDHLEVLIISGQQINVQSNRYNVHVNTVNFDGNEDCQNNSLQTGNCFIYP
jgi:hypothetical protein